MSRGKWRAFKIFIMAYSWQRTSCVFIQFYYLLPHPLRFETSEGFRTKLVLQTLCTRFSFFFSSFALRFNHCTSIIPHTPIYRAFKLTNSYLQIYLVKPWLISTVFKPTLQLFEDKTLEYLKILNSKKTTKEPKIKTCLFLSLIQKHSSVAFYQ